MKSLAANASRRRRRWLFLLLLVGLPALMSRAGQRAAPVLSAETLAFHQGLAVADLHLDPLLWNRPLDVRQSKGQVDVPRLLDGQLDMGIFGIVTEGLPIINGWQLFTWWTGWKKEARQSRWAAAVDQLDRLDALIKASNGKLVPVRNSLELETALEKGQLAVFAGVEGGHALDGEVARIQTLADRGVLYMGPIHLNANALGGTSFVLGNRGGLTPYGREVIQKMESIGMWVDLAHMSEKAFWEALELTHGPVLCSHTGIYGVEPSWRNLKDDQLQAIARRDGIIGVMLATNFIGGKDIRRWAEHVKHAARVAGVEHVALGSDFDGFIQTPKQVPDAAALAQLTYALLEAGFTKEEVSLIMGGNFRRMLKQFRPGTPSVDVSPAPAASTGQAVPGEGSSSPKPVELP